MKDIEQRLKDIEQRLKRLEAATVKPLPAPPLVDGISSKIKDAIINIEHTMLNRDLIRSDELSRIIASLHPDPLLIGFNPQKEEEVKKQSKFISTKLRKLDCVKSMMMTSYYTPEEGYVDTGTRRFNQSVWVIRNHKRYEELTATQLCNEYKAQRDRVNVEYHNRCKELGWNKGDYPDYPWYFPTDQGPKVPADKPSFI